MADRRRAFQKMQRIHAWQNWLDEKRCRTYRDSDTREWRARRDRWDITKVKAPLFGTRDISFYDVEEARDWRQAADDRRKLNEPIEMKPIPWRQDRQVDETPSRPEIDLPAGPSRNEVPFIKRDAEKHAAQVAERARQRMAERGAQERTRRTGRKRRPRPR